ncbi:hypothetical protein B0H15DRAFT_804755 [Mycena belliarum]|uniref:Uncharacterized protein n=1 Tax=Mycena belliarum TaxID=1033014 RepID=A0AAD6XJD3_9AGAR|nr:hypothetical protein B0H15DRAFT_804755 [Mycena belliae]
MALLSTSAGDAGLVMTADGSVDALLVATTPIATVHAARRHRVLAAQTLRALGREAEGLRREVNEWRLRARVPPLAPPPRSDAHAAVLRAETEDFDLTGELEGELEEEGEEEEEEEPSPQHDKNDKNKQQDAQMKGETTTTTTKTPTAPTSVFAFEAPGPGPVSPSAAGSAFGSRSGSSAGSGSGSGSEGPGTPPASAVGEMQMQQMHSAQMEAEWARLLRAKEAQAAQLQERMQRAQYGNGKGYYHPQQQYLHQDQHHGQHGYDRFAEDERAMLSPMSPGMMGVGMHGGMDLGAIDLGMHPGMGDMGMDLGMDMGGMGLGGMGMDPRMGVGMGIGGGGGWARASPAHPAFHLAAQQQQMRMGMGMGVGVGVGVGVGQYLHQPGMFA